MLFVTLLVSMFCFGAIIASASTEAEIKMELKETIDKYIRAMAVEYGVDAELAVDIAHCESGLNHLAVGDKGKSFGLWQIHLPAHPSVTTTMALDPIWATEWAMPRLKDTPYIWTCAKLV